MNQDHFRFAVDHYQQATAAWTLVQTPPSAWMTRLCSYCGTALGAPVRIEAVADQVSHGACDLCLAMELAKFRCRHGLVPVARIVAPEPRVARHEPVVETPAHPADARWLDTTVLTTTLMTWGGTIVGLLGMVWG